MASLPRPDGLPLAGVDELAPAHVMTMLRPGFYGQPWTRDYESRTRRYAAVVAMHALAGAGATELNGFETDHFDAGGLSVLLTFVGASRYVFVTPALRHALVEWTEIRKQLVGPDGGCRSMFVVDGGKPLYPQTIDTGLRNIGERLGAPRPLSAMLTDFFRATVAKGSDPEAYRYVLGTFPNHVTKSSATLRDVRDLVAGTDRIGGDLSFLTDEARAAEIARAAKLPLCLDEMSTPKRTRALEPAHPLAIRLATELEARPEDPHARALHDVRVVTENLDEMEPLIRALDLSIAAAGMMFGIETTEFAALRQKVLAAQLMSHDGAAHDRRMMPMTAEEKERIAGILAEPWPDDPEQQIDFRIDLLRREFPFVHSLMAARKLNKEDARRLFKATFGQIDALKKAGDEGRLAELLADLTAVRWTKSSSLQLPMTDTEKARLARIGAERWPEDPIFETDFRIDLMRREFPFVRGLILQRHLTERAARELFKATFGQIKLLMAAGREGKLEKLLKNPPASFLFVKGGHRPASEKQRERVERLAGERWPDDPADWPGLRRRLLRREYPFVLAMVRTGRLVEPNIGQLFRLTWTQNDALRQSSEQGRLWKLLTDDIWHPPWTIQTTVPRRGEFVWPRPGKKTGRPKKARTPPPDIRAV